MFKFIISDKYILENKQGENNMADNKNCYEELKPHFKRIWFSLTHPFSENPYSASDAGNKRIGWNDILCGHAFVNLVVEWCRACPYTAGHFFFFENYLIVLFIILLHFVF